ncbi:DUF7668 domain-containing protein [Hymenobacter lutimineralis]|nr:hypothetical protein [Hymenobacter lutimineralis]
MNQHLSALMTQVVIDLVNGNYQKLVDESQEERQKPEWLEEAVRQYPGKLTQPPAEAFDGMDVYEIDGTHQVLAEFDLWVNNEPSDLTVKVLVYQPYENMRYTVWDLLVM